MRTFQMSDAKSHKFWSIDVTGSAFTVTYGKVGTAGTTSTKTFPTPEKAQAEADKLVREKTGKGYREVGASAAPSSDTAAFERGLIEHPEELVRWCAYSDYLTERGDPRGEFMRVQLALEDEALTPAQRKALKAEEKTLLKQHQAAWLGPLAAVTVDGEVTDRRTRMHEAKRPPVVHRFERGWLAALNFFNLTVTEARAYSAAADARLVHELVVEEIESEGVEGTPQQYIDSYYAPGPDVPTGLDPYEQPALHALTRCPHLGAVRSFRLGELMVPDPSGEEYSNCHTSGELAHHLVKQMPHVESVELYAHRVDAGKLFALPMPKLHTLVLYHSVSYPLDKLAANKSLTNLTTLRCYPHAMEFDDVEQGAYIRLEHLKAICRSPHLTQLTHLCLRLTNFGDAGAAEIVASGVLKRLKMLDIQGGCMSDEGARRLAACPDFKRLEHVNLKANALTDAGVEAIRATGVNADVRNQHTTTTPPTDSGDDAEYLYMGDME